MMSGPYGDFHIQDTDAEMLYIGGGAGMAPLRSQIMHMLCTLHTRDREMHFFYGARSLSEAFFLDDFWKLEKEYPNFHMHLSLDQPDPVADAEGVKYYQGFAVTAYETLIWKTTKHQKIVSIIYADLLCLLRLLPTISTALA